jgi:prephenate dehydrogenase
MISTVIVLGAQGQFGDLFARALTGSGADVFYVGAQPQPNDVATWRYMQGT